MTRFSEIIIKLEVSEYSSVVSHQQQAHVISFIFRNWYCECKLTILGFVVHLFISLKKHFNPLQKSNHWVIIMLGLCIWYQCASNKNQFSALQVQWHFQLLNDQSLLEQASFAVQGFRTVCFTCWNQLTKDMAWISFQIA